MANSDNIVIRSRNRLLALLGIKSNVVQELIPTPEEDAAVAVHAGTFSDSELSKLPAFKETDKSKKSIVEIESMLNTTADRNQTKTKEARSFKALTPEIGKARSILIPSIMSPNDIQDDHIQISVEVNELPDAVNAKLSTFLQDYFNNELKLGIKISNWIGDALFETGATPVLVLPKQAIRILDQTIDLEEKLKKEGKTLIVGTETIDTPNIAAAQSLISTETLAELTKKASSDKPTTDSDSALSMYHTLKEEIKEELSACFGPSISLDGGKLNITVEELATEGVKNVGTMLGKYKNGISFSTDFRSIITPAKRRKTVSDKLLEKIQSSIYGGRDHRLMVLGPDEEVNEGDHPTLIELSSDCVIPVAIPGSKTAHIGYFVLVDRWGCPINRDEDSGNNPPCHERAVIKTGNKLIFNGTKFSKLPEFQQTNAASIVFGLTVRKMLEGKLKDLDAAGFALEHHQNISSIMYRMMLNQEHIHVVFVPSNLMVYYAFDYRDDGTGKSLLEDSSFLLGLRNTLMIAKVMAAIKNSTNNQRVEFNVGDQVNNVEQLMALVESIYVNKRMLRFDHNPMTVVRDLVRRSISIVPKGLPGLDGLSVTTEANPANTQSPDEDLLTTLTNLIITNFGVPHSVLNMLGENEFSRSIATTNLFFSNDIRAKQRIVCDLSSKLIRQYLQLSHSLMTKISEIIDNNNADTTANATDKASEAILRKVINHVHVYLPTPAIAVNKAQFEELRTQIETIDTLVSRLYDDALVPDGDSARREVLAAMRAMAKYKMLKDAISNIGAQGSMDIPDFDDISESDLRTFNLRLMNVLEGINKMKSVLGPGTSEGSGGAGGF